MTDSTEKKQQYQRLNQITIARSRYLGDGGDLQQSSGSHKGKDYLTEEEKKEIRNLGNQVFEPDSIF